MTVDACRGRPDDRQAALCHALIRKRDVVREIFGQSLCANPNWDILLTLYWTRYEGRRIMVTALCAASHVPEATAYRKIEELERLGLIVREHDPSDRRRVHVSLSTDGVGAMGELLARIDRVVAAG